LQPEWRPCQGFRSRCGAATKPWAASNHAHLGRQVTVFTCPSWACNQPQACEAPNSTKYFANPARVCTRCAALAVACSQSCSAAPGSWEQPLQLLENQVHLWLPLRQAWAQVPCQSQYVLRLYISHNSGLSKLPACLPSSAQCRPCQSDHLYRRCQILPVVQVGGLWRRRYAPHGWREATLTLLAAFLQPAAAGELERDGCHDQHHIQQPTTLLGNFSGQLRTQDSYR
jgi:hypothetical protein